MICFGSLFWRKISQTLLRFAPVLYKAVASCKTIIIISSSFLFLIFLILYVHHYRGVSTALATFEGLCRILAARGLVSVADPETFLVPNNTYVCFFSVLILM